MNLRRPPSLRQLWHAARRADRTRAAAVASAGVAVTVAVVVARAPLGELVRAVAASPVLAAALPVVAVVLARIADVTLGVLRTVFIVSGRRTSAGMVASAEAGVWLAAAGIVLNDLTPMKAIAYCVGVGAGTIVGMAVVRAAKWGMVTIRIFVPHGQGDDVAAYLRGEGLGATVFTGQGRDGPRDMVMSMARRREAAAVSDALAGREDTFCLLDTEAAVGAGVGVAGRV